MQHEEVAPLECDFPRWIAALRGDLDPDTVWLLRRNKALSIPQEPLRDSLLSAYTLYVHPFLPLLDLEEFVLVVRGEDETKKISLVLFQAVMFAATAFVDMVYLESNGFTSHKEARRAYYERVRVRPILLPLGSRVCATY